VSASLLHEAGLDEWIAANESEYVAKAIAASRPDTLASQREAIRHRVIQSRLFDALSFAEDFETTLRDAWRRWCHGVGDRAN
jgi:predicted O-linked N-acetylglucosamine transferase (SPINDLY family)